MAILSALSKGLIKGYELLFKRNESKCLLTHLTLSRMVLVVCRGSAGPAGR